MNLSVCWLNLKSQKALLGLHKPEKYREGRKMAVRSEEVRKSLFSEMASPKISTCGRGGGKGARAGNGLSPPWSSAPVPHPPSPIISKKNYTHTLTHTCMHMYTHTQSHLSVSMEDCFQDPLQIPKYTKARVPYIKWHSICMQVHILQYILNNL